MTAFPADPVAYRSRAIAAARQAAAELAARGVRALVADSLARDGFDFQSDVDLLITHCPRDLKYAIEGLVEDALGDIPFDVIYLDDLSPWKAERFAASAVDASELR